MIAPTQTIEPTPVDIFISYSHEDEESKKELKKHLRLFERQKLINSWNDTEIQSGAQWSQAIHQKLDSAPIILFLISPDFLNSDYINDIEIEKAMKRHEQGDIIIIPIFVRECELEGHPLLAFQGLPSYKKPISSWANKDEAWTKVVQGLKVHIQKKN